MSESGVGGVSMSEIARRMGMRPPSLYKHFPSLHAVYDELFRRGSVGLNDAVAVCLASAVPGRERLIAVMEVIIEWCVANPTLAQLMFWRPVPGFEPSADAFAPNVEMMDRARREYQEALDAGILAPGTDLDEFGDLCTVLLSGLFSQQISNEPGVDYAHGRFSSRTRRAVEILLAAYAPKD